MNGDHVHWEPETSKIFLDLCIAEKEKLNFTKQGMTKKGWANIYPKFAQMTKLNYSNRTLNNKLTHFKKKYTTWKGLQSKSGLGRDKQTGGVTADASFWDTNRGESSNAATQQQQHAAPEPCVKPPQFLDELEALFGGTVKDRGSLMFAGGLPTPCSNDEAQHTPPMSPQDIDPTSVARSSKRYSMDTTVESPPKKRNASLEDCVRNISEAFTERSQQKFSREQQEIDEALDLLCEASVSKTSEQYFRAIILFKHSVFRRAFTKMKSPEARLMWIDWTWNHRGE